MIPLGPKDLGVTPREFDILRLALQGNAPWKIAAILEINPVNVRRYLSKLYGGFMAASTLGKPGYASSRVAGLISVFANFETKAYGFLKLTGN